MTMPRGRAWPVIFLLLLAPLVAEVLWGSTTVTDPAAYLVQIGLYGGGAVLIRELVAGGAAGGPRSCCSAPPTVRSRKACSSRTGSPRPSKPTPTASRPVCSGPTPCGTSATTPSSASRSRSCSSSWRSPTGGTSPGWAGVSVTGAVYAVSAAVIGLLWWAFVQPTLLHVPARVHPVQQGAAIALVIVLIAAARLAARTRTSTTGGPAPPAAGWLAGTAALGAIAWFGLLLLSVSGNHLHWLPFPVPITAAAAEVALAAWALRNWSARTDLQVLAVCTGALIVQMAAGFAVLGAAGLVNIIGKAILNIIAASLLAWFALRLHHATPVASALPLDQGRVRRAALPRPQRHRPRQPRRAERRHRWLRPLAQHPGFAEGQLRHRLTDPSLDRLPGQGCVTSH